MKLREEFGKLKKTRISFDFHFQYGESWIAVTGKLFVLLMLPTVDHNSLHIKDHFFWGRFREKKVGTFPHKRLKLSSLLTILHTGSGSQNL
jgi:hypothetical protein